MRQRSHKMADNKSEDSLPTSVRRPTPIAGKVPVTKGFVFIFISNFWEFSQNLSLIQFYKSSLAAIPPATLPNVSEESERQQFKIFFESLDCIKYFKCERNGHKIFKYSIIIKNEFLNCLSLKGRRDTPMAMNASPAELKKLKTPKCSTLRIRSIG